MLEKDEEDCREDSNLVPVHNKLAGLPLAYCFSTYFSADLSKLLTGGGDPHTHLWKRGFF